MPTQADRDADGGAGRGILFLVGGLALPVAAFVAIVVVHYDQVGY